MFYVIFRDHQEPDGTKGRLLVSTNNFPTHELAQEYAEEIAVSRQARVVDVVGYFDCEGSYMKRTDQTNEQ